MTDKTLERVDVPCVVYASDNRFAEILGISLVSLFKCSGDMSEINVYILDSDINNENKLKIKQICNMYKRKCPIFITAKNISQELGITVSIDRGSLSQYARLFVSSILPNEIHRILYLDCDILFKQSIKKIWELDLQEKTVGVLMDAFSKYYRANIDLKPNDIMFNSGVMLIDLDKWKQKRIEQKILEFISNKKGKIQQGDQGALNAVLAHDVFCFDPCFNAVTIFFDFTYSEMMTYRQPPKFYSPNEIKDAILNPVIVHFTTSIFSKRPWIMGCKHRYVNDWLECKMKSPWKDTPLWKDNRSILKRGIMNILGKLPRNVTILIASIMQVYGRPLINRIK